MTFPVGPINLLEFTAHSNYNAGYVQAKRRLVRRVELPGQLHVRRRACPTHRRSDRRRWNPRSPQDSFDLAAEWGPAGLRHPSPVCRQPDLPDPAHVGSASAGAEPFAASEVDRGRLAGVRRSIRCRAGSRSRSACLATRANAGAC